jgi:hypothetical protein
MIDLGQYDAWKSVPVSMEEQGRVFAKHRERMKAYTAESDDFLCQDLERKLSLWFESKVDAKETFRRTR